MNPLQSQFILGTTFGIGLTLGLLGMKYGNHPDMGILVVLLSVGVASVAAGFRKLGI